MFTTNLTEKRPLSSGMRLGGTYWQLQRNPSPSLHTAFLPQGPQRIRSASSLLKKWKFFPQMSSCSPSPDHASVTTLCRGPDDIPTPLRESSPEPRLLTDLANPRAPGRHGNRNRAWHRPRRGPQTLVAAAAIAILVDYSGRSAPLLS